MSLLPFFEQSMTPKRLQGNEKNVDEVDGMVPRWRIAAFVR